MSLRIETCRDLSFHSTALGAWNDLFESSPVATPFQSPAWQSAWWKHLGGSKRPLTVLAWEGRDLVGFMPLAVANGSWRTLRAAGTGVSDYLWPLTREGYEASFGEELLSQIRSEREIDLVDLHQIREGNPILERWADATMLEQAECCVLKLPETYAKYVGGLGKSLRYDVRGTERGAFKSGEAQIRTIAADSEVSAALDTFFALHSQRWKGRGLPGAFALRKLKDFQHVFALGALRAGILRLSLLEFEGRPIGAIYAMRAGSTTFFYQSGFDPAHKGMNPGTVLVSHAIRQAIEEGCSHFDFLRGAEPYKLRWKPQRTFKNLRLIAPLSRTRGSIGKTWNIFASGIEGRVRRRLEGRSLRG